MRRVMLDLETLDTGSNALILSIGAVFFDEVRVLGKEFYEPVNQWGQQSKWGRTTSPMTIKWWSEQSEEAKKVLFETREEGPALKLDKALLAFTSWLGSEAVEMWANGADFDCVILGNAYAGCGLAKPWSYSNNRCHRTLKNLGIRLDAGEGTAFQGTAHNALDDAKYQAHYASAWLRRLKGNNSLAQIAKEARATSGGASLP